MTTPFSQCTVIGCCEPWYKVIIFIDRDSCLVGNRSWIGVDEAPGIRHCKQHLQNKWGVHCDIEVFFDSVEEMEAFVSNPEAQELLILKESL